jgi:ribonuclease E
MANKMLIDATHPEETRVVVVRGNRVEEFDFESATRRQLKGNIYLAKVTRVEPSLQAAFVDYGGNRHGFLAFSEIHPDYYQIPVADRQALLAEEERAQRAAEAELDQRADERSALAAQENGTEEIKSEPLLADAEEEPESPEPQAHAEPALAEAAGARETSGSDPDGELDALEQASEPALEIARAGENPAALPVDDSGQPERSSAPGSVEEINLDEEEAVESVGAGDAMEDVPERTPRSRRQYKIQEVIKRRQVMLVQVVKEERGTKGAALTSYLSLAGRYSVLMPNTARGGGISRKITNVHDRKRLKEIAHDLEVPEGMGVILRTAGANRTKAEIKRDFEYLLRLWETVRDLTLKSTAPTLVYEEGSLIKRSIRDLYNKDIDEVLAAGDAAYREAKEFMRMLMPSHAKNVKPYRDAQPIFTRYGVETQLDAMFSPTVQLRSGGYLVMNQTEALVSIDVNSGRATREHHIEDTALKTNLEAAEEIARQLRLRDLAGLIVIDFIDMDEKRNNRAVERRLKDCLKHDRARIQVGRISHFGLMEMSRQRIRASVLESSTDKCPHCGGTGHIRSVGSVALQLLRTIEDTLIKGGTHNLVARTRTEVALYVLNHKRGHLRELEQRFRIAITVAADPGIAGQQPFVIERGEQVHSPEAAKAIAAEIATVMLTDTEAEASEASFDEIVEEKEETVETGASGRQRRQRRRPRHDQEEFPIAAEADLRTEGGEQEFLAEGPEIPAAERFDVAATRSESAGETGRRRRRGRRGGRRRRGREVERVGEPFESPLPIEAELSSAVADFDRPPHSGSEAAAAVSPEPGVPAPSQTDEPVAEPGVSPRDEEPPRHRSTIREPAPSFDEAQLERTPEPVAPDAAPAPEQPAAEESPAEDRSGRPRRTGWWLRRLAGKG